MAHMRGQTASDQWVSFPGGELEGIRPKALCAACREQLRREAAGESPVGLREPSQQRGTLCFQCYRAEFERERALGRAGELDTASEARFQFALPFESVNRPRLDRLKAERGAARMAVAAAAGPFVDRRRQAQIVARHALQAVAMG